MARGPLRRAGHHQRDRSAGIRWGQLHGGKWQRAQSNPGGPAYSSASRPCRAHHPGCRKTLGEPEKILLWSRNRDLGLSHRKSDQLGEVGLLLTSNPEKFNSEPFPGGPSHCGQINLKDWLFPACYMHTKVQERSLLYNFVTFNTTPTSRQIDDFPIAYNLVSLEGNGKTYRESRA